MDDEERRMDPPDLAGFIILTNSGTCLQLGAMVCILGSSLRLPCPPVWRASGWKSGRLLRSETDMGTWNWVVATEMEKSGQWETVLGGKTHTI